MAVALDQLANAVLGGDPHASISSRAYRAVLARQGWGCVLCGWLDRIQRDHCRIAWEAEMAAARARIAAEA